MERVLLRFNTRLILWDQTVIVGKPRGIAESLANEECVRFRIPWAKEFEVRMEIAALHVNLANGSEGFVCRQPSGQAVRIKRGGERFSTRRYTNLQLHIPEVGLGFPVVDLSSRGCRIKARSRLEEKCFKVNRRIREGMIQVGDRFHIHLDSVVPRVHLGQMVGLEFDVGNGTNPQRNLKTLLGILAMQEVERLATGMV
ncbi:MAG TPA: hypothetical protein VKB51_12430 [bacterium]|nr:hypothetical protein [bacterium]